MPETEVNFDAVAEGERISKETVVFELHVGSPGFIKPIDPEHFVKNGEEAADNRPDADAALLHVSQDILDRKELREINQLHGRFAEWLRLRCIPSPVGLGRGFYLLRLNAVEEVNFALQAFTKQRNILIDAFGAKYEKLKADAQERRGQFYNESDYPAWSELRKRWTISCHWLSFNVPAAIERMNRELFEAESRKVKVELADAADEARQALRVSFAGLVDHLVTQLGVDNETGKRKKFHPASLNKLLDFINAWDMKSLTEDTELKSLLDKAKEVASGVSPDDLKKDFSVRDALKDAFEQVKTKASELAVTRERKFFFKTSALEETAPEGTIDIDSEMRKQPEDRNPETLDALVGEALEHAQAIYRVPTGSEEPSQPDEPASEGVGIGLD